jgi:hypothetical protein
MKFIGLLLGAKQGDILLAERYIELGQRIQGGKLAWIGLGKPNMGHGSG